LIFGIWSWGDLWIFFIKLLVAILVVGLMILASKYLARVISRRIQDTSIADDEYTKKVSMLISNIIYYTLMVFAILVGFKIIGLDFSLII
jgi:small-conductance mechanosensitive channel